MAGTAHPDRLTSPWHTTSDVIEYGGPRPPDRLLTVKQAAAQVQCCASLSASSGRQLSTARSCSCLRIVDRSKLYQPAAVRQNPTRAPRRRGLRADASHPGQGYEAVRVELDDKTRHRVFPTDETRYLHWHVADGSAPPWVDGLGGRHSPARPTSTEPFALDPSNRFSTRERRNSAVRGGARCITVLIGAPRMHIRDEGSSSTRRTEPETRGTTP